MGVDGRHSPCRPEVQGALSRRVRFELAGGNYRLIAAFGFQLSVGRGPPERKPVMTFNKVFCAICSAIERTGELSGTRASICGGVAGNQCRIGDPGAGSRHDVDVRPDLHLFV